MAHHPDTSSLIETIYAAGIEPARWPDVLDQVRRLCRADSAAISVQHVSLGTGSRIDIGYETVNRPRYFDGFAALNPLFTRLLRQPIGVPHPDQTLIERAALVNSPYFNDYCRPNGIHFMAGLVVSVTNDDAEWVTVNRSRSGGAYQPGQLRALSGLAPHLRRARETGRLLGNARAGQLAWEATLDMLKHGLVLLDQHRRVVFANRAARDLAVAGDGFTLRSDGLSAPAAGDALARVLAQAVTGGSDGVRTGGHVVLRRRLAPQPLSALVVPLPRDGGWNMAGAPAVLVLLSDPAHAAIPEASQLMAMFGLTEREAALTASLTEGETLGNAALRLGIGHETARTHLAHALAKTGTARQVDLVRLALAAAPPVTPAGGSAAEKPPISQPPVVS